MIIIFKTSKVRNLESYLNEAIYWPKHFMPIAMLDDSYCSNGQLLNTSVQIQKSLFVFIYFILLYWINNSITCAVHQFQIKIFICLCSLQQLKHQYLQQSNAAQILLYHSWKEAYSLSLGHIQFHFQEYFEIFN